MMKLWEPKSLVKRKQKLKRMKRSRRLYKILDFSMLNKNNINKIVSFTLTVFFWTFFTNNFLEAIDPEIDLTQLNRNEGPENLDQTAVLKQPLDLNAIQQNPIVEEEVVKEEDADFPDDKEKRGKLEIFIKNYWFLNFFSDPSVILQDPLARDQDNDVRIYEAIQNGFDKKTGQSPPSE